MTKFSSSFVLPVRIFIASFKEYNDSLMLTIMINYIKS